MTINIIYHESFEAKKFCGFHGFLHVRATFLYVNLRWHCLNMDFMRKYVGFCKTFLQKFAFHGTQECSLLLTIL